MSCQQVCEFVDAYMDGELDAAAAFEFERHLAGCDACRAACEQYRELHARVHARLPYFNSPEGLENKVRATLHAAEGGRNRTVGGPWFPNWRAWAIAAGIAFLFAFSALLFQIAKRSATPEMLADQVVSSHIRSLMANHLVDVPSSDRHTVKPWFDGKVDFAPVVKDLSSKGFPLAGGRLDYLDNRPVAALVYKRRQHIVNLFIWPSSAPDAGLRTIVVRGYNVVHWTRAHMAYWAASDLSADELQEFAHDIAE